MAILYAHINKTTGEIYIGQTKRAKAENRWANGEGYKALGQNKFYNAIKLYGWDNFIHKVIERDIPNSLIDDYETTYINYYDTVKKGYNSNLGKGKILKNIQIKSLPAVYFNDSDGILRSKQVLCNMNNTIFSTKYYNDKNGILRAL